MNAYRVKLRHLAPAERDQLEKLSRSRTAPARVNERARLLLALHRGETITSVAKGLHMTRHNIYNWIRRFNENGLKGLEDRPRSGRPHTYTIDERVEVIATALTHPDDLNLPFGCWTLDRLEAYLNEEKKISIKRSRIDELLLEEGLKWRKQETWYGKKVDPEFKKKEHLSKRSIRRLLKAVA